MRAQENTTNSIKKAYTNVRVAEHRCTRAPPSSILDVGGPHSLMHYPGLSLDTKTVLLV